MLSNEDIKRLSEKYDVIGDSDTRATADKMLKELFDGLESERRKEENRVHNLEADMRTIECLLDTYEIPKSEHGTPARVLYVLKKLDRLEELDECS
jgi:hypothetical protein